MTLGFPFALWLLALAVFLLLATHRRPTRRLPVGTLFLWRQATARDASTLAVRVRRNWLLALQVLVVVAAVLALATPLLPWGRARVAIVIDTSASMGAIDASGSTTTRLEAAASRARAALDDLPRATRVVLWTSGARPARLGEYGSRDAALRTRLTAIAPTSEGGDIPAALRAADAADEITHAWVFSDRVRPERLAVPSALDVRWQAVGQPVDNVAITNLAARWRDGADGGEILANVQNFGATPIRGSFRLSADGATIAERTMALEPAGRATVILPAARTAGLYTAHIDVDDALAADNTRFLRAQAPGAVRVALVGRDYFVERALAANGSLSVEAAAPGTVLADVVRTTPDVLVCIGCMEAPLDAGRVLLVRTGRARLDTGAPLALTGVTHPLAASLTEPGLRVVPIEGPDVPDESVVAAAGGWPVLVASDVDGRRVVELRMDLARSDVALTPAFPLLVAEGVAWLSQQDVDAVVAGEPIRWMVPAAGTADSWRLEGPAGSSGVIAIAGDAAVVTDTGVAGVYRVRGPALERTFVVNAAVEGESDLTAPLSETDPGVDTQSELTSPVDLSQPLLLIVVGLLGCEWWFRARREGVA